MWGMQLANNDEAVNDLIVGVQIGTNAFAARRYCPQIFSFAKKKQNLHLCCLGMVTKPRTQAFYQAVFATFSYRWV